MSLRTVSLTSPRVLPFLPQAHLPTPFVPNPSLRLTVFASALHTFSAYCRSTTELEGFGFVPSQEVVSALLCLPEWQLCEQQPKSACSSDFLSLLCWGPHPQQAPASRQSARGRGPRPVPCFFSLTRLFWALGPVAQPSCCHSAFLFHFGYSDIVIFLLLGEGISFKISLFMCMLLLPCFWSKNCEVTELSQSLNFP